MGYLQPHANIHRLMHRCTDTCIVPFKTPFISERHTTLLATVAQISLSCGCSVLFTVVVTDTKLVLTDCESEAMVAVSAVADDTMPAPSDCVRAASAALRLSLDAWMPLDRA